MKNCILPLLLVSYLISACGNPSNKSTDACVEAIFQARAANTPIPLASKCYGEEPSEQRAYEVQGELVQKILQDDSIAGFKAAVTSKNAQDRIGATKPMSGVLFSSGVLNSRGTISTESFVRPLIEVELGYKLNAIINDTLSMTELKSMVSHIVPVIELPDIGFQDFDEITSSDVAAGNAGSVAIIQGNPVVFEAINLNSGTMTLSKDGELINTAQARDALGDQWTALHWLVNNLIDQGYTITPEHVLITGALGTIVPMTPGVYTAEYPDLSQTITFSVE